MELDSIAAPPVPDPPGEGDIERRGARPRSRRHADGFAPARNPEMRTPARLAAARRTRRGGTCAAFSAAAPAPAGFTVERRRRRCVKRRITAGRLP
ncbi:MnmC family methyltransferase [Albimonas pacifica]|uniref:S-adenosyl-L-methionine-dependent methyltransferase n=1 Tax=Albimonas pacifica TaxID=1114924 RepID=A0A1I3F5V1_9RHOB|nr:MnmC family methyltransferase [Albimonas pacifica]SFI06636.1 S-adenosyl-L-methionine-dependent methyltransferase [Albimonas pacifica]